MDQLAIAADRRDSPSSHEFGLHHGALGFIETLAQSISTMGPTCSPAMTVPLVFASAGNGTWLAYLIALVCTLLVALCVARFSRESSSPGSLYSYATSSLPPALSSMAGWALLIAYIGTGASVAGGFVHYAKIVLRELCGVTAPALLLCVLAVGAATAIAYRDVKVSAQLMVYIELASVFLIAVVFAMVIHHHGWRIDAAQFSLRGVRVSGVRLGVVLAMFSFVGFESATTLGQEARDPLTTIPRAVILSAVLAGGFFVVASYTEVLGFSGSAVSLDQSASPMSVLATSAGISRFGPLIDVGAMISMFACTLACVTAAARVLLMMAFNDLAPRTFAKTHARNGTPHRAVLVTGVATGLMPIILIAARVSGESIYDWMGSLATYGFIVVYALLAIALPLHLKKKGTLSLVVLAVSGLCVAAMAFILEGTLYPAPPAPLNYLPYAFLGYLAAGAFWGTRHSRNALLSPVPEVDEV